MVYLHSLFERNVLLNPNSIALKFENIEISYQELNSKSNQLANYLVAKHIEPGDKVLICLNRSIEMIIAILAVLKAGGTYVPIDTKTPANRLNLFIEDFDNPILINNAEFTFESNKVRNINLAIDSPYILEMPLCSPVINMDEEFGAVILYTSGSTGQPKGVLLTHKSLVNRLLWDADQYEHSSSDIVLQHASYNFDFSIFEIFMALANCGKLILARSEFHYESTYLLELIQNEKITKMGSVPSLLQAYINLPAFENCSSLKQVFLGGESLKVDLQNNFFLKSNADLINIYGPTETSISVLNWKCIRDSQDKIIPIGFPVAGMEIYIVDDAGQVIDDDRIGEIYISGIGVASEYYKRPDLTQKHFVRLNNKKMFRTFDLGKKLPNGAFQFCGRLDNQIKIRGLRVELEEIEYHINHLDSVRENVVHLIENENFQKKIVAYIILHKNKKLDSDFIRRELETHLPDYMIPSYFVAVDKFELSPNGKIDKNKLPLPESYIINNSNFLTPNSELQEILVEIWSKVLKMNKISISETLENLGGDSITILEIHYHIEEQLGCKFPIAELSKSTTILDLSKSIERINKAESEMQLIQVHSTGNEKVPLLFVGPVYGNSNSASLNLVHKFNNDYAFLSTLEISDTNYTPQSIEDFAKIYVDELVLVYPSDVYILGGYSMGGLVALEMVTLLKQKGKIVKGLYLVDTYHPIVIRVLKKVEATLKLVKGIINFKGNKIKDHNKKHDLTLHPSNLQKVLVKKVLTDSEKLQELAINYIPKKYKVMTVSISANKETGFFSKLWRMLNAYVWSKLSYNRIIKFYVETDHVNLLRKPFADKVAEKINEGLKYTN